jgi:hypothetical protein
VISYKVRPGQLYQEQLNIMGASYLVIREYNSSQNLLRQSRKWSVCGEIFPEKDTQLHLDILCSVSPSTLQCTTEHCSAGRSAYFSLNAIGHASAGCTLPLSSAILPSYPPPVCLPCATKPRIRLLVNSTATVLKRTRADYIASFQTQPASSADQDQRTQLFTDNLP